MSQPAPQTPSPERPQRPVRPEPPRIPNFKRLLVIGTVVGAAAGVIWATVGDEPTGYGLGTVALYLGAMGAVVGLTLAALLGIALDKSGRRRS